MLPQSYLKESNTFMTCKILINAVDVEECRIAKVRDSKLEEFHIESASVKSPMGTFIKA